MTRDDLRNPNLSACDEQGHGRHQEWLDHVKYWEQVGQSREPCDVDASKQALTEGYRSGRLPPPRLWVVADSPASALVCDATLRANLPFEDQIPAQVKRLPTGLGFADTSSFLCEVNREFRGSSAARMPVDLSDQSVEACVRRSVLGELGNSGWRGPDGLPEMILSHMEADLRESAGVCDSAGRSLERATAGRDLRRLETLGEPEIRCGLREMDGQPYDVERLGIYAAMIKFLGYTGYPGETWRLRLAQHCGRFIARRGWCILQHRPIERHVNAQGESHNHTGMALRYRDGWGIWALDGHVVDEQLVLRPETQTLAQINTERNNDVRAIRLERFGMGRYIAESGAVVIDEGPNEIEGTYESLLRVSDGRNYFWPTCPSGRVCPPLAVPREVTTREQARNWLAGSKPFRVLART